MGMRLTRLVCTVGVLGWGVWVTPEPVSAQQNASVVVQVNVIRVPMASATLDSLGAAVVENVSAVTRARAEARATRRGVRLLVEPKAAPTGDRPAPEQGQPREVLRVEYVAN